MNKRVFTLKTPAKINIGLRILYKRKDDYHNLETIFFPIKIFDVVRVEISKLKTDNHLISVHTTPRSLVNDKSNICLKAAKFFLSHFKINEGYRIRIVIKKNIPVGAGLGGGSSDAAAVLKILFGYFKNTHKSVDLKSLQKLALKFGSDIPFFLNPVTSYGYFRGEKLTRLKKL